MLRGRPWRSSGWLGQQRREVLLGEPPEALPEPDSAQQLLVLVDPAGRDTQRLGDLLHGQIAAHRGPPGTAANRRRRAGRARAAGGRTTVCRSDSAAASLDTSGSSRRSSRPTSTMPPELALPPER